MKVIKYILSLVFVLVFIRTEAQVHDVFFNARFQDVPFSEFATTVEQQTGVQFYYINQWVQDIKISASGNQVSLHSTLLKALVTSGLHFYITEDSQVFITGEQPLVTTLPDYSMMMDSSDVAVEDDPDNGMTTAEKKYFEARKTGVIETIVIGQESENWNQSASVINGKMIDGESGEPLIGATIYVQSLK